MSLLNTKQVPLEFQVEQKKFKKYHKIKHKNIFSSVSSRSGGFSLVINEHLYIQPKRLLTILKVVKPGMKSIKRLKRRGKKKKRCLIEFEANMDTILTKKPKDIRMGRGKGAPSDKVNAYKFGKPIFTVYNLSSKQAFKLLSSARRKFSSKNNIIENAK